MRSNQEDDADCCRKDPRAPRIDAHQLDRSQGQHVVRRTGDQNDRPDCEVGQETRESGGEPGIGQLLRELSLLRHRDRVLLLDRSMSRARPLVLRAARLDLAQVRGVDDGEVGHDLRSSPARLAVLVAVLGHAVAPDRVVLRPFGLAALTRWNAALAARLHTLQRNALSSLLHQLALAGPCAHQTTPVRRAGHARPAQPSTRREQRSISVGNVNTEPAHKMQPSPVLLEARSERLRFKARGQRTQPSPRHRDGAGTSVRRGGHAARRGEVTPRLPWLAGAFPNPPLVIVFLELRDPALGRGSGAGGQVLAGGAGVDVAEDSRRVRRRVDSICPVGVAATDDEISVGATLYVVVIGS